MAESMSQFRLPPALDLSDDNLAETFRGWRRQLDFYLRASGATEKPPATQTAIILHCAGVQVQEAYEHFVFDAAADKDDPQKVLQKLSEFCSPRSQEVIETFRFWNAPYKEPFDSFLTELRSRANRCNFDTKKDRMIRDKIVFSAAGKMKELLLREKDLDLARAVEICRAYEVTSRQTQEMAVSVTQVDKVAHRPSPGRACVADQNFTPGAEDRPTTENKETRVIRDCKFCGLSHDAQKIKCPAWGKSCRRCNGSNHFQAKCRSRVQVVKNTKPKDCVLVEDKPSPTVIGCTSPNKKGRVTALMRVNDCDVRFELDSGADVNIICTKFVKKHQITPTQQNLTMWNGSTMRPVGEAVLNVCNPKTWSCTPVRFTVVDDNFTCLLGVDTVQELGLITVNTNSFIGKVSRPGVESGLGDLGEAKLTLRSDAKPRVLPCRHIPFALQDEVRQQIDVLVDRGVLVSVDEPTAWVSQMAVARKESDGSLRICIDPQPLNEALMREHYKMPTLDDVLPQLHNAKVFSKLDVKEAFWHVRLDEESSRLTTMITPFGRYRWARLPFGLSVSSEIFQKKLNDALNGLNGVICVADDIVVVGRGDTKELADSDHAENLRRLQERCKEKNIRLNDKKAAIKQSEIIFMGHRISAAGIQPDRAKIAAILDMPAPTDVHGVRRLCGMVQYLAKFLPNLADDLEPIRALTKKDCKWNWSPECAEALRMVKEKVTKAPVLVFFDPSKELLLQVDSSKSGVGAVIMQDGKPIEYASRALSSSEQNWAQLEKEALALVYGLERFDQYTYGRSVRVQNDHKPLATILRKPLSQASRRVQALMMRLYRYDFRFQYVQGTQLFIADALSRAYIPNSVDDVCVLAISSLTDIPDKTRLEVQEATMKDPDMQTLLRVIREGWPEHKKDVPECVRMYFDIRETLNEQDGVVLKGERVLVPRALRSEMRKRLHAAHLGYDSMLRRARELLFWPGMAQDIKQTADSCEACQQMKPCNQKETLQQHNESPEPWLKIGTDLFECNGRTYIVTVDYHSSFIEVDYLTGTTANDVVTKLQGQFARYGIPAEIVSDQGPQFTSAQFKRMTEEWGITHTMSSPGHHQSNGKAEAAVKSVKHMMRKCLQDNSNPYMALLELRNTPMQDTGLSPTQMTFGRFTRTKIPAANKGEVSRRQSAEARKKRQRRRRSVKKCYDKRARDLTALSAGQTVFYQHVPGQQWKKGRVMSRDGDREYTVEGDNGGVYQRNRVHMRPTRVRSLPDREVGTDAKVPIPCDPKLTSPVPATTYTEESDPGPEPMIDCDVDVGASPNTPARPQRIRKKPSWLDDYVADF